MRKLKLYIAVSIDGMIARPDGDVSWLDEIPNPDKTDYGYQDFLGSIDTTIMGFNTYSQILGFGIEFPYKEKLNFVFSRQRQPPAPYVTFVEEEAISFIRRLKQGSGGDIWLIGGGQINALCQAAELIDEYHIFVMPVILGAGIPIFEGRLLTYPMVLTDSGAYASGVVRLVYRSTM